MIQRTAAWLETICSVPHIKFMTCTPQDNRNLHILCRKRNRFRLRMWLYANTTASPSASLARCPRRCTTIAGQAAVRRACLGLCFSTLPILLSTVTESGYYRSVVRLQTGPGQILVYVTLKSSSIGAKSFGVHEISMCLCLDHSRVLEENRFRWRLGASIQHCAPCACMISDHLRR
jgi:hypothetical protein